LNNPNEIIRLTLENGKLNYRIIPFNSFPDIQEDPDFNIM
jgi:hypothetical protein